MDLNVMKTILISSAILIATATSSFAAVGLDAYADKNGFINVHTLTCNQLANTFQEDADQLATWYSGWYNGLAKKHYYHLDRNKTEEHRVIVYCKEHPEKKVIDAVKVIFKREGVGGR